MGTWTVERLHAEYVNKSESMLWSSFSLELYYISRHGGYSFKRKEIFYHSSVLCSMAPLSMHHTHTRTVLYSTMPMYHTHWHTHAHTHTHTQRQVHIHTVTHNPTNIQMYTHTHTHTHTHMHILYHNVNPYRHIYSLPTPLAPHKERTPMPVQCWERQREREKFLQISVDKNKKHTRCLV